MDSIAPTVLLIVALVLMALVGRFTDERGGHTIVSFLLAIASILLVFASVMSLYVFK